MMQNIKTAGDKSIAVATYVMGEQTREAWMRENFGSPTAPEDLPVDEATESIIIERGEQ